MATSGSVVVWIAVNAGSSHSTVQNVTVRSPLMALFTLLQTTAVQTATYTEYITLEVIVREFRQEPSEWGLMLGTVQGRNPGLMLLPGGTPWPVS